ncbi:vesicle-associated membrane protein [Acrasis kona]|uniref:Vesicle-associated membrane protein n=1 Tax=Acrasis kona TaxID=1008807 RepID=A0AAW2YU32_9EUKA
MVGIQYSVVAKFGDIVDPITKVVMRQGFVPAGEYPNNKPTLAETARTILANPKLKKGDHLRTLEQSTFHFHYKVSGEFCYMCISLPEFPRRITFEFLNDIETQFLRNRNIVLRNLLKDKMAYFNNTSNDQIYKLKDQIDGVKVVMIENFDKALEKGEALDRLLERSNEIVDSSHEFKKGSAKLKNAMLKRNLILVLILVIIALVVVFIIIWAGCGIPGWERCRPPATAPPAPPAPTVPPPTTTTAPPSPTPKP